MVINTEWSLRQNAKPTISKVPSTLFTCHVPTTNIHYLFKPPFSPYTETLQRSRRRSFHDTYQRLDDRFRYRAHREQLPRAVKPPIERKRLRLWCQLGVEIVDVNVAI
jgi:hypothetical protein